MLRPLGEERQSHWAFLNKAYDAQRRKRALMGGFSHFHFLTFSIGICSSY